MWREENEPSRDQRLQGHKIFLHLLKCSLISEEEKVSLSESQRKKKASLSES